LLAWPLFSTRARTIASIYFLANIESLRLRSIAFAKTKAGSTGEAIKGNKLIYKYLKIFLKK